MLSLRFSLCGQGPLPRRSLFILFVAFIAAGCGGPTGPQTLGPVLMCPANLTVQSADGNALPVIYEAPAISGGKPPVNLQCSPPSGANFNLGASTVTCTATDAERRTSSCAFTVTVAVPPPQISATSFVAFGNSITEGKTASGVLAKSYAENLRELLAARYAAQSIAVVNAGCGGESTMAGGPPPCIGGVDRLPAVLDTIHPEVVLLEEGINDLSGGSASAIPPMIDALRTMIHEADSRNVRVFLATLPPERQGGSRAYAWAIIPEANAQIRMLATSEHATLVDLYEGFAGSPDPYIDTDGLHPNELGYQKIGQLFFEAIRASLEPQSGVASSMELVRNMPSQPSAFPRFR